MRNDWLRVGIAYFVRKRRMTRKQRAALRALRKVERQRRRLGRIRNGR